MIYTLTNDDYAFALRVATRRGGSGPATEYAKVELGVMRLLEVADFGPYLRGDDQVLQFPYWRDEGVARGEIWMASSGLRMPAWDIVVAAEVDAGSAPPIVRSLGWYCLFESWRVRHRLEDLRDMMKLGRRGRTWAEALAEVTNG